MTPSQLRASRPQYQEFPLRIFDGRVRQAIRKHRFINWMNDKREEVLAERKAYRKELNLPEETPREQRERLG